MSDQMNFLDTPNAISSPASVDGVTPCERLDGLMVARFGPEAALANLSARQAKEKGLLTSGTYGPRGSTSSSNANPASSLVSRLKQRSGTAGSTLFNLTWKEKATPSGRSVSLLRASGHRTSGSGCGSWRSPTVSCVNADRAKNGLEYAQRKLSKGQTITLVDEVHLNLASWPTPNSTVIEAKSMPPIMEGRKPTDPQIGLADVAVHLVVDLASWPTPRAEERGQHNSQDNGVSLSKMASWATPTACSPNSLRGNGQDPEKRKAGGHAVNLQDQVRLTVSGEKPTGSPAATEKPGQLNPAHSRWLMGYPPAWDACAVMVMPSSRKSRLK